MVRDRVLACRGGNLPSRLSYVERIGQRGTLDVGEGLRAGGVGEMGEGGSEILQQLFIRLLRIGPGFGVSTHVPALGQARARRAMQRPGGRAGSSQAEGHTDCETSRGGSEQQRSLATGIERGEVGRWGGSRGDLMKREMPHGSSHRGPGRVHGLRGQASFIRLADRAHWIERHAPGGPVMASGGRGRGGSWAGLVSAKAAGSSSERGPGAASAPCVDLPLHLFCRASASPKRAKEHAHGHHPWPARWRRAVHSHGPTSSRGSGSSATPE